MGRFINADGLVSTGQGVLGSNMFAYCLNNPVDRYDPTGMTSSKKFYENVRKAIEEGTSPGPDGNYKTPSAPTSTPTATPTPVIVSPTGKSHTVTDYPNYNSGGKHRGTDMSASAGDPIVAAMGGTVLTAHYDHHNGFNYKDTPKEYENATCNKGYGNYVVIVNWDGQHMYYAHLQNTAVVSVGQIVSAGDLIGYAGNTGYSKGTHLHYEVRSSAKDGSQLNPQDFLP